MVFGMSYLKHQLSTALRKLNLEDEPCDCRRCETRRQNIPSVHDWTYSEGPKGPRFWHLMKGVKIGKKQSPLDFTDATLEFKHAEFVPAIFYQNALENTSTSDVHIRIARSDNCQGRKKPRISLVNTGHSVQIDFPVGAEVGGHVLFEEVKYHLKQIHFHSPAEHRVHGTTHRMEAHFVHVNEDGGLLVMGMFINVAEEFKQTPVNFLDFLLHEAAQVQVKRENDYVPPEQIDLEQAAQLIMDASPYFCYEGSLTTPPFTEGVHWIVGHAPVFMRRELILALESGLPKGNARPVQSAKDIGRPSLSIESRSLRSPSRAPPSPLPTDNAESSKFLAPPEMRRVTSKTGSEAQVDAAAVADEVKLRVSSS